MLHYMKRSIQPDNAGFLLKFTSYPLCLMSSYLTRIFTWESTYIVTWSSEYLYVHSILGGDGNTSRAWKKLTLPLQFADDVILEVRFGTVPGYVWLLVRHRMDLELLKCSFLLRSSLYCSRAISPSMTSNEIYDWDFISAAHSSIIAWTKTEMSYIYDEGETSGQFNEITSVKHITFNHDHSEWIVLTEDNVIFYGTGKCTVLTRLRKVDGGNDTNISYKFRSIDNKVMRLTWTDESVRSQIYPLYNELYAVLQSNETYRSFCQYTYYLSNIFEQGGNVLNLENIGERVTINFTLMYPYTTTVSINLKTNLKDLIVVEDTKYSLYTNIVPGRPLMRTQSVETTLVGTCATFVGGCEKGIAMLEVQVLSESRKASCLVPMSKLLFFNVTCPVGLHLIVRAAGEEASCVYANSSSDCYIALEYPYTFYLTSELYSFEKFLHNIHDSIKIIEINNRTGFELHNKILMMKDCYLCSEFNSTNSSSELIIQTVRSACPCKLHKYNPDHWTGNITFENADAMYSGLNNNFVFNVSVLGRSYCDLESRLVVHLLPKPTVLFVTWEYIVICSFAGATLLALGYSYRNYMIFIEDTKSKAQ